MERLVRFPVKTILTVLGLIVAVWALLHVIVVARSVIVYILIALFLALAINPLVAWLMRRGIRSRGVASGAACLIVLAGIAAIGFAFIPTLVDNVNNFADAAPGYVHDLTNGKGRLGFLETKYHVVERLDHYIKQGGAKKLLGFSGVAISVTKGVLSFIVGAVTVAFLTFFMLLEGPVWVERFYGLLAPESEPRWRAVGRGIYRQVGGYVTGNLAISLIAGVLATFVLLLLGVPFAIALGLLVGLLDLIPLVGATVAAVIVVGVGFLHSVVAGIVLIVFFVVYQQVENHVLQPLVYNRTVALSPLAVLISILVGAELAGVLGALAAIPVAGAIQVVILDFLQARRERAVETPATSSPPG
ncbi:MAG TPA: AI-2E family transporter [Gaiellaceae bacterium]|jgi:predicted PurR-regulated permease PerM